MTTYLGILNHTEHFPAIDDAMSPYKQLLLSPTLCLKQAQTLSSTFRRLPTLRARTFSSSPTRSFSHTFPLRNMEAELTAPNGKKWSQPLGLFINNEFIKSGNDQKITTINPA